MNEISFSPFPELHTRQLILRRLSSGDLKSIFLLRSSEEVNFYLDRPKISHIEEAEAFIQKINHGIDKNEWIYWVLSFKEDEKLIGTICLWNFSPEQKTAELGYELNPDFQGKALMSEAFEPVLGFAFDTCKFERIIACTHRENLKSIGLLQRTGFQQTNLHKKSKNPDAAVFEILKNNP